VALPARARDRCQEHPLSRFDLLVAGGGPGGATLAALAARAGLSVLAVERERFPRGKVCGGFVSAEGAAVLERLGVLSSVVALGAQPIERCSIAASARARIEAALPDVGRGRRAGLGVSRDQLDATLLDRARRSGATVLERHVALPLERGGAAIRPVGSDRPAERIDARVIVAADGRSSAFGERRLRRQPTLDRSWFGLATQLAHAPSALAGRVELHSFDGGYVGLCTIEEQRASACMLVRVGALRAAGGSPERLFAEHVIVEPSVRAALGNTLPASGRWHAVGPLRWGVAHPAAQGVLFVGDAAGTIDPLCGEGMSHALVAAELALPFVVRAAEAGVDAEIERGYTSAWRAAFRRATRRARLLGFLLERRALARVVLGCLAQGAPALARPLVAWSRTGLSRSSV
jgi:menaquinone-9 beta-reductase